MSAVRFSSGSLITFETTVWPIECLSSGFYQAVEHNGQAPSGRGLGRDSGNQLL